MKRATFSRRAHRDIEEISEHIFDLNPAAAMRFLDSLDRACKLLTENPLIGRERREIAEKVRSFAIGSYLIFYIPTADGITVARIIYGGRDLRQAFHTPGDN